MVEKQNDNKQANTSRVLKHQGDLIQQGICPDTLQPMTKKYFVSKDFIVQFSPYAKRLYYGKPAIKQAFKNCFGALAKDLKHWCIGQIFETYVKINKKYPEQYIKEFPKNEDNIEVIR